MSKYKVEELWAPIAGYEGRYKVSTHGRVKSLERVEPHARTGYVALPEKILAERVTGDGKGYLSVVLYSGDGKKSSKLVHRLVAHAFFGEPPEGKHEVNHRNGDTRNNCILNLEYMSPSENIQHAIDEGLRIPPKGEKHGRSKLTEDQVREMKGLFDSVSVKDLAKKYSVSESTVKKIKAGRTWSHVETECVWANYETSL